jgi:hypothetical protein
LPTAPAYLRRATLAASQGDRRPVYYSLYGLAIETELDLPCKPAHDILTRPLVRLRAADPARLAWLEQRRRSDSPVWGEYHRTPEGEIGLRWAGLFSFAISSDGHDVYFVPAGDVPADSLFAYLLGQVLSFPLLSFGFEPLHATAVVIDGEAIAFVGDCGYGKSTLAAGFVARGVPVLSDDLLVLEPANGRWLAHPGIPRLKLFPEAARQLLGPETDGVPMNAHTSKLVLPLADDRAVLQPVPLRAMYALSDPREESTSIAIEPVKGAAAFLEVTRAAFNLQVLDAPRLANQFAFAERIAADVPVRRLTYPRSLDRLPAVCDSILADAAKLGAAGA